MVLSEYFIDNLSEYVVLISGKQRTLASVTRVLRFCEKVLQKSNPCIYLKV